jgi:hypothetical protein
MLLALLYSPLWRRSWVREKVGMKGESFEGLFR